MSHCQDATVAGIRGGYAPGVELCADFKWSGRNRHIDSLG